MTVGASGSITLRGLVLARWVLCAVALAILVLGLTDRAPMGWHPRGTALVAYGALLVVWAAINLFERYALRAGRAVGKRWAGAHLLVDVAAVTGVLALSGGAANPFTMLYMVPLTLAIVVSPRWTWAVAGASLIGFGALFLFDRASDQGGHAGHFGAHLRGMWVAYGVTGALVTYAVHWIATRINREREELTELRERALADRHLAQVGSLAAGAAHELGTPLATLRVLAGDLDRMSADEVAEAGASMRHELARCKEILARMSVPEPRARSSADVEAWRLADLADEIADSGVTVAVDDPGGGRVAVPRGAVSQVVRELVTNARAAAGDVRVNIARRDDAVVIEVEDDGVGMSADVVEAAFDPFFSTKPEGEGQGLGLYLARAQARLLGGTIELDSHPQRGTRAVLRFPAPTSRDRP